METEEYPTHEPTFDEYVEVVRRFVQAAEDLATFDDTSGSQLLEKVLEDLAPMILRLALHTAHVAERGVSNVAFNA